jgi:hypothetical protein
MYKGSEKERDMAVGSQATISHVHLRLGLKINVLG